MRRKLTGRAVLFASAAAIALTGATQAAEITKVEWIASKAPTTPQEMSEMFSTAKVRVTRSDGTGEENPLGYQTLFLTTDRIGTNVMPAGTIYDEYLHPIMDPSVPGEPVVMEEPDGSAILTVAGKLYHLANLEYDWLLADGSSSRKNLGGILPSGVVMTELAQDPLTGQLVPVAQQPVDFSGVGGFFVACNAEVTPWGTFLTSQENYSADGRKIEAARKDDPTGMNDALTAITVHYHGGRQLASPYQHGQLPEVIVKTGGTTEVVKHFAMGRGTPEMGKVFPDGRTVLIGNDGTNKPLTMFVADKAGDLSSGTLYAAKLDQTSAEKGGHFKVSWVRLGHATDEQIQEMVDRGITFSDIFETADAPTEGFTEVYANTDKKPEYLKVKNETAAAFLETMRYAGMRGASTEFRKAEGVAFDPEGSRAFLAISDIDKGMLEGKTSGDAGDQMRLSNVDAGAVYALPVAAGQKDTDGNAIDSDLVPVEMFVPEGLLGVDLAEKNEFGDTADRDFVANPDNLYWSSAYKTLFVGEDSGMHTNNVLWAWQDGMTKPVRLLTAPAGAELTGLRIHEDIGGFAYALTNAQHVGDFKPGDNQLLQSTMMLIRAKWQDRQAAPFGYVTGLPTPR